MEAVYLPNLNALTTAVQRIRDELSSNTSGEAPELLFRGQADSTWPLTTTLERMDCESMSFDDYYRLAVTRVRPAVEAFTNVTWDVPDYDFALADSFRTDRELFSSLKFPSVGFYSYMVYLRHITGSLRLFLTGQGRCMLRHFLHLEQWDRLRNGQSMYIARDRKALKVEQLASLRCG